MAEGQTLVIGAGLSGLSTAIALSARGEKVVVLERAANPGGKMRQQTVGNFRIDAGPTVLTMKWVFDRLFGLAGTNTESEIKLSKADVLARHAWDGSDCFDLFADLEKSEQEIERFFSKEDAAGYRRFCEASGEIFNTLRDSYITASRPTLFELVRRVGITNFTSLMALRPFQSLWNAIDEFFPDARLQQLFGRYSTYVGSSPYLAPATLMLIANVEQQGVWLVDGGMFQLAEVMAALAIRQGADFKFNTEAEEICFKQGAVTGVSLKSGEFLEADRIVYCGEISWLADRLAAPIAEKPAPTKTRSMSAITWSMVARTKGFELKRHNVFFSDDYQREFEQIFDRGEIPGNPTIYLCAQDRQCGSNAADQTEERLFMLINAPAFGDREILNKEELVRCTNAVLDRLLDCGLELDTNTLQMEVTQPADFEKLFPSSGGALYGAAMHGWMAPFSRHGTNTNIPGFYLASGSVHPGAGVPMATLSGMLAAEQIISDLAST